MKKIIKNPMFWGSAIFLLVLFIGTTKTSFSQIEYGDDL
jgi:hypothetical protein